MMYFDSLIENIKQNKKEFKTLKCHPMKKKNTTRKTCMTNESMLLLKMLWNQRNPNDKINSRSKNKIHDELKQKLEGSCENEKCWIQQIVKSKSKQKELFNNFAPNAPRSWSSNINEWLSSRDIKKVMLQYEDKHKNFKFLGPSPIDFDTKISSYCVWPEICKLNLRNYKNKGVDKIGLIFNTDTHDKGGSHWIAMFVNMKSSEILFFDSNGNDVPRPIMKLVTRLKEQGRKLKIDFEFKTNVGRRHQDFNTECGMYCLYFIISLLEESKKFEFFKNNKISDKSIELLRHEYFNI